MREKLTAEQRFQRKAANLIDRTFELENKASRMRGEKPPHPSKAKRKASGYGQPKFPQRG